MKDIYETIADLIRAGETFAKLYAPVGLNIGGETPEEIAISIAAEVIAAKKEKLH